jgi:hypothetical protein
LRLCNIVVSSPRMTRAETTESEDGRRGMRECRWERETRKAGRGPWWKRESLFVDCRSICCVSAGVVDAIFVNIYLRKFGTRMEIM